ncbi:hypothetical protein Tsp_11727 [Trichinella spiralis]|uniref:hypothetical protein n=1 Tax=Trichinella spiralis TaxID=6334 RepID=UPI0001EFE6E7|nr:hypothetical protein Tsp_11727 [Trichinella spiralis]
MTKTINSLRKSLNDCSALSSSQFFVYVLFSFHKWLSTANKKTGKRSSRKIFTSHNILCILHYCNFQLQVIFSFSIILLQLACLLLKMIINSLLNGQL